MAAKCVIPNFKSLQEISFIIGKFIKDGCVDKGWQFKDYCTIEITELGKISERLASC